MPITMEGDQPLVDVTLNGRPVRFLVDTGAYTTLLTPAAAQQLGLKPVYAPGTTYGVGGSTGLSSARIRDFKLGDLVAHDFDMVVTGRIKSDRYVGLLGRNVLLARYDLELDLANHVMRLFKPKDCHGDEVVYWSKSYSLASIDERMSGFSVDANLNGRRVWALLDTGASRSVVTLEAAHAAGVTPQSRGVAAVQPSLGMGGAVQTWIGTFQTLAVGDETVKNAELELADLFSKDKEVSTGSLIAGDTVEMPGMVLGADFIKAHRIFIARSQGKLYFTYNGGQIFEAPAAKAAAATGSHPSAEP